MVKSALWLLDAVGPQQTLWTALRALLLVVVMTLAAAAAHRWLHVPSFVNGELFGALIVGAAWRASTRPKG